MPLQRLQLQPGIDVEKTPLLNSGGWSSSNLIRWRDGLPEKYAGWTHLNQTPLIGTGRGMHAWADLLSNPYVAIGTDQRLQLLSGGTLFDITPIRLEHLVTPIFSTVITSTTVTVTDANNGAVTGDWINVQIPVAIGGMIIQGFYRIVTVVDANNYTITAATAATATVVNGGTVPSFTVTNGSANVLTTLVLHGLIVGSQFNVNQSTLVGGLLIPAGTYTVTAPVTANTFTFVPGGVATSNASASEAGGKVDIQYLLSTGGTSPVTSGGYGIGIYGAGVYGIGSSGGTTVTPLRQWFLDNWGQDLIGNYTNGPAYLWVPPLSTTPATPVPNGPLFMTASFVAMPQQIFVALGAEAGGSQDPSLVRWTDVADFTDWNATATNQAGSFRIASGSRIVGGIRAANFCFIWTDVDFWVMNYIQPPFIFGFSKIASGCDLIASRAAGIFQSMIYWVSNNNFFLFNGSNVQIIPCPVWDKFFLTLDRTQKDKIHIAVNSWHAEITWFFPSLSGGGEVDSYVKYNARESLWDYGALSRTCWHDDNPLGAPMGVDAAGLIQQHEQGFDADGQPMLPFIQSGFMSISDGTFFTFVERLLPDLILQGGTQRVFISIITQNYTSDPLVTYGPFAITPAIPYIVPRARGRVAAIRIFSTDLGVFWRIGAIRYLGQQAGRR